ncbi:unnamed protein product [Camellia sinensis]
MIVFEDTQPHWECISDLIKVKVAIWVKAKSNLRITP